MVVTIRHWVPIITFCPHNNLPDFIYISLIYKDKFRELYSIRKRIRSLISGRKLFMEDIAKEVSSEFTGADSVEVRLLFNRHIVKIQRGNDV